MKAPQGFYSHDGVTCKDWVQGRALYFKSCSLTALNLFPLLKTGLILLANKAVEKYRDVERIICMLY